MLWSWGEDWRGKRGAATITSLQRFAIFATVAGMHPVGDWTIPSGTSAISLIAENASDSALGEWVSGDQFFSALVQASARRLPTRPSPSSPSTRTVARAPLRATSEGDGAERVVRSRITVQCRTAALRKLEMESSFSPVRYRSRNDEWRRQYRAMQEL